LILTGVAGAIAPNTPKFPCQGMETYPHVVGSINGAQLPVDRFRANQRSIEGSLTLYRLAASGILHSTLAITRSRRSIEYAFIPSIMPSNR